VHVIVKVIGLDQVARVVPVNILRAMFPTSSNKVFVPKEAGNPPYFDAMPLSSLQERIMANNSHAAVLQRYQRRLAELTGRGGIMKVAKKQMVGLESYDINSSAKYVQKFGFNSEYLARVKPNDWILAKRRAEVARRQSSSSGMVQRRGGANGAALNTFIRFENNSHADQVEALLRYCSPTIDDTGTSVRQPYRFFENTKFFEEIEAINLQDNEVVSEPLQGPSSPSGVKSSIPEDSPSNMIMEFLDV
jgi:hypothetical protein